MAGFDGGSWSGLDKLRVGRWGEQLTTMALTQRGLDVYLPAVDDRAIDLLVRIESDPVQFAEVQVKTIRLSKPSYLFMRKKHFAIGPNRFLALVVLQEGRPDPEIFIIPSTAWSEPKAPFVSRDFEGLQSEPEFGLTVSRSTLSSLERYRLMRASPFLEQTAPDDGSRNLVATRA
ncbi:hypothetical protein BPNPMPFG_002275 [Mesorhizobium sp. AR07]|uniref:hypothetical protein n=1 Tax=Mesorhizobium sp. AR07 TaxID=2865838 RepID=UPI0021606F96|nr:hypothetical protein [Mesorhizobium sp. AR07]UVK46592.1 hypothetical protein BPNPMPFG_002275 [Mesorhizobium sp. AR07]